MVVFNYKQHLTIGIILSAFYLVATKTFTVDKFVIAVIFSLLPDADQLQSKISQIVFNVPTKLFKIGAVVIQFLGSAAIAVYCMKYVKLYSDTRIAVGLLFLVFFIILEPDENFIKRRAAESMSLLFLLYGVYSGQRVYAYIGSVLLTYTIAGHRSFVSHSLFSMGLVCLMASDVNQAYLIPAVIGYGSHLAGDHFFEVESCPLYFPLDAITGAYKSKHLRRDMILTIINSVVVYAIYAQ